MFIVETNNEDPAVQNQLKEKQAESIGETSQLQWNDHSSPSESKCKDSEKEDKPQSLLGSLLSTKRTSPLVPQSRTDTHSGLNNVVKDVWLF